MPQDGFRGYPRPLAGRPIEIERLLRAIESLLVEVFEVRMALRGMG